MSSFLGKPPQQFFCLFAFAKDEILDNAPLSLSLSLSLLVLIYTGHTKNQSSLPPPPQIYVPDQSCVSQSSWKAPGDPSPLSLVFHARLGIKCMMQADRQIDR